MQIDWWTLGLQTVNALVLIWLLSRFLFRPMASILADRKAAAAKLMDEAASAESSARALQQKAQAALDNIASDRTASIRAAAAEADEARNALLEATRSDAARLRAEAEAEILRRKKAEWRAQAERANLLAVDIARRLLERLPQTTLVSGFVEGLVGAIAALPDEIRADFCRPGAAILTAPRPLTTEEEALCRTALEKALGRPLEFGFRADPALLAGLELEDQHTSIRNSLRADLDRIKTTLLAEQESAG